MQHLRVPCWSDAGLHVYWACTLFGYTPHYVIQLVREFHSLCLSPGRDTYVF